MGKELLFSISKDKGDFIVEPFKGSGKGGQKRNKTMSACRIKHPASGVVVECQEERSFEQNKRKAFERLAENEVFNYWLKLKSAKKMGIIADVEQEVEKEMNPKNIKIEIQVNGKWVSGSLFKLLSDINSDDNDFVFKANENYFGYWGEEYLILISDNAEHIATISENDCQGVIEKVSK